MPSPTTALQVIQDALGLTNAVGIDQTLTASETSDCLRKFNDLIENLSTQRMAVYGQANQTFNTVPGQAVYTIGSGGNWNTARPERIDMPAYSVIQGATFPCAPITQDFYNLIAVKGQTQEYPDYYLYVAEFPLGLVTLWPVPSAVTPVTFSIDRILTQIASAGTTISFPQGYTDMWVNNLAVRLGPLFGKNMTNYPDLVKTAEKTLGDIKRSNRRLRLMNYDPALLGYDRQGYWDWRGY